MPKNACSETQAGDRFGIVLDFITKLHNDSITDEEAKRFLRRENPFSKKVSFFSVATITNLDATAGKETSK